MSDVYLGLGTNLGEKKKNIHDALNKINEQIGEVTSLSTFYETPPWGFRTENIFLNAVVLVNTSLTPLNVLKVTQSIEREMGRETKTSVDGLYSDRIIDIDLLLYDNLILNSKELILPHPLMTERLFVMEPLAEIAPELIHPVLHKSMKELYDIARSASFSID